ncbi:MAG: beta-lactamase family protein, partial [Anaerolineae bacterium]|nr:beta-lactamase family protein [Anaerolineae bacterium]
MNNDLSSPPGGSGSLKRFFRSKFTRAAIILLSLIVACILIWYFTATCCAPPPSPVPIPSPTPTAGIFADDNSRLLLSYNDLIDGFAYSSPVDNRALAEPGNALPPTHTFEGRLELLGEAESGEMLIVRSETSQTEIVHLPEFDFKFVQSGGDLIPVQRGLIITSHPNWNYILGPGRVWQEPGDQGYSRASFPFALSWKSANAIFNGVMTFLFDDEQVSQVWYQITQETTASLNADLWGLLEARYHPGTVSGAAQVRSDYARESAARFPTKPIEQLAADYPGVDLSTFGSGITPAQMTWYGLVYSGVNYLGGCGTRYGPYPYCESMRAPSYSTAKTAFVSAALMRLAQMYGEDVPASLIADHVPEAAASPGDWSRVTFDHTLDMATGNYRSPGYMVDEEQWDSDPFWKEEYYAELITAAFNWPHSSDPGTQWVYRTSDTFILTQALQNYLRAKQDPDADIFEFVVQEIYIPLEMGPGVYSPLRTRDDDFQGQPYGGYGMWWIPDDLAKIASFMGVDGGRIAGEQILHPATLAA